MKKQTTFLTQKRMKQLQTVVAVVCFLFYDIPPVLAVLQFTENRSICVCQAAGDISHASHTGRLYNPAESSDI